MLEVDIAQVALTIRARSWLNVGELLPGINVPKLVQEFGSGIGGGRRRVPEIETDVAVAGVGKFVGKCGDKPGQLGVLGGQVILTAGPAVRNEAELRG